VGEVGEIHVKSRHIALGYWRDADRTGAAFVRDPHDASVRIYRTGDLGVRANDGCLTHVGRRDFQVKIRGFRIDVSEIEVAMHAIDGVKDAVVVPREDKLGEPRLIGYFVPSATPAVTATHIRRNLLRVIPDYMIPATIVCLDAMPQTPNGKTDRLRLPAPSRERPQLASRYVAPTTAMERTLQEIWSDILGIDGIGIHDDFFELGGDSLGAARVVGRMGRLRDTELPFTAIYETPTIAELAKVIGEGGDQSMIDVQIPRRSRG
jgi:acyl carrier protein